MASSSPVPLYSCTPPKDDDDNDDEELAALRLAALLSRKSNPIQPVPVTTNEVNTSLKKSSSIRTQTFTHRSWAPKRRNTQSIKSASRSNLIVINPVALDEKKDPLIKSNRYLSLPQDRWCKTKVDGPSSTDEKKKGPSRFRYKSDSETSDSDWDECEEDNESDMKKPLSNFHIRMESDDSKSCDSELMCKETAVNNSFNKDGMCIQDDMSRESEQSFYQCDNGNTKMQLSKNFDITFSSKNVCISRSETPVTSDETKSMNMDESKECDDTSTESDVVSIMNCSLEESNSQLNHDCNSANHLSSPQPNCEVNVYKEQCSSTEGKMLQDVHSKCSSHSDDSEINVSSSFKFLPKDAELHHKQFSLKQTSNVSSVPSKTLVENLCPFEEQISNTNSKNYFSPLVVTSVTRTCNSNNTELQDKISTTVLPQNDLRYALKKRMQLQKENYSNLNSDLENQSAYGCRSRKCTTDDELEDCHSSSSSCSCDSSSSRSSSPAVKVISSVVKPVSVLNFNKQNNDEKYCNLQSSTYSKEMDNNSVTALRKRSYSSNCGIYSDDLTVHISSDQDVYSEPVVSAKVKKLPVHMRLGIPPSKQYSSVSFDARRKYDKCENFDICHDLKITVSNNSSQSDQDDRKRAPSKRRKKYRKFRPNKHELSRRMKSHH